MTTYYYAGSEYSSQAEVDTAVTALKARLDNNPTDWVVVLEVTGSDEAGWTIPTDDQALTDEQINNLDSTKYYSVSAIVSGDSFVGLNSTDAAAKVLEMRGHYAGWKRVNCIVNEYAPTNQDMSGY